MPSAAPTPLTVDLESQTITGPGRRHDRLRGRSVPQALPDEGLDDIGLTMEEGAAIDAFELFSTLFLLSLIVTAETGQGSSLALIVNAFGIVVAAALDFPFSPVQMIGVHLPPGLDPFLVAKIQGMTGLATLVFLIAAGLFALLTRLGQWPSPDNPFNVWINLPTFDPNGGGDIVKRLRRTAAITMIVGAVAPFVLPVVGVVAANHVGLDVLGSPHALVWGITLWMFIPLSLIMRGLAMSRIARMIGERRDRLTASLDSDAPSAAVLSR
jgi:hypothetical protein